METAPQNRLTELREMPYERYLHTPEWRRRRNRALELARWRCQWPACREGHDLEVHHRSYEHLGDERDEELQVLCPSHHQRRHAELETLRRLHWRVIRDVMNSGPFACLADFVDEAKYRLLALRIRVPVLDLHELLGVAVRDVPILESAARFGGPVRDRDPRISEHEATAILANLKLNVQRLAMPSAYVPPEPEDEEAARERAWEMGIEL